MYVGNQRKIKGFNDMIYDIWFFDGKSRKVLIFKDFLEFCLSAWKLSLCRDELAYVLPEKLVLSNSF